MAIDIYNQLKSWKVIGYLLILIIYSCSEPIFESGVSTGIIEYTIEYPQIPEDSYLLDLMPKSMETTFSDGNFRSDIVAGMGLFKTSIICEKDQKKLVHSVKMLNTKLFTNLNSEEIRNFNPHFSDLEITTLDEKKEIAGYSCQAAKVKIKADSSWFFKIYYTNEIDIPNSNLHTPYKEIEGVLMQYDIISYDTHMRFTAKKVIPKEEIDIRKIQLEEGYTNVSAEELKEEIESIFAKVK